MTVKRFEAADMPGALKQVRADLGEDAVILETKRVRAGLTGAARVQVLAAIDPRRDEAPPEVDANANLQAIQALLRPASPRDGWITRLTESGVADALAGQMVDAALQGGAGPTVDATATKLMAEIARRIPVSPSLPTGPGVRVALVGPTGVGKTTTVAKLAARYALTERKRVAVITMDTYRIGAVEQIRTYTRLMGLPLDVAHSPEEMRAAAARHADKDLVLIDTVGRSPGRAMQIAEIKAFLNAAEPAETHLTLAATGSAAYLAHAAEQFAVLGTDRLIVTKLDEMPAWGVIPTLTHRIKLPVSFLTDGQDVPRNIRPANAVEIARLVMGGAA